METEKENYFMECMEQIEKFIWQNRCSPEIRDISIWCAAAADKFIDIP